MPSPLDIRTREDLIHVLTEAAVLEHEVMCQYLYAAFSLKTDPSEGNVTWAQLEHIRTWKTNILLVARQEMEHLGLVCNLLTAVGGTPYFRKPDFPRPARYCPALRSFDLRPFSREVIEGFMHVEKVHGLTTSAPHEHPGRATIGDVYAAIGKGFETLAASNEMLFVGSPAAQVGNATIDLRENLYDINLIEIADLQTAQQAIDQIIEAGDEETFQHAESHYERFETIRDEYVHLKRDDPNFEPARPVAVNPVVHNEKAVPATTGIEHPLTRQATTLFNTAYETMNLMLLRFYTPTDETEQERLGLKKIVFFPMMTMILRPLGEMLTRMPVREDQPEPTAGPSFECGREMLLHPHKQSAWIVLHERLQALAAEGNALVHALQADAAPWARALAPRMAFLHENLEAMTINFERYTNLRQTRVQHLFKRLL